MGSGNVSPTDRLRGRFGDAPFAVADGVGAGVSRATLYRMLDRGSLSSPGRGVLQLPTGGAGMDSPLAAVSARVPRGTICLNSSLAYWDLTDEIPANIHLAVPRGSHRPTVREPATRVHVFAAATFAVDRVRQHTDVGEPFWTYSAERSIVDALRMHQWVGLDVGLGALRRYIGRPGADPARLAELARQLGGRAQLMPALEVLLS